MCRRQKKKTPMWPGEVVNLNLEPSTFKGLEGKREMYRLSCPDQVEAAWINDVLSVASHHKCLATTPANDRGISPGHNLTHMVSLHIVMIVAHCSCWSSWRLFRCQTHKCPQQKLMCAVNLWALCSHPAVLLPNATHLLLIKASTNAREL